MGRPKGSRERAAQARQWATRLWDEFDCDVKLKACLEDTDPKTLDTRMRVILRLAEWRHGKPIQPREDVDEGRDPAVMDLGDLPMPNESSNADKPN